MLRSQPVTRLHSFILKGYNLRGSVTSQKSVHCCPVCFVRYGAHRFQSKAVVHPTQDRDTWLTWIKSDTFVLTCRWLVHSQRRIWQDEQQNRGMRRQFWAQQSNQTYGDIRLPSNEITAATGAAQSVWWLGNGVNDRDMVARFPARGIFLSFEVYGPTLRTTQSPFNGYPTSS